jgi:nicotinate-nucleotide adenylyltransferase
MHFMYGGSFNPPTRAHEAIVSCVKSHIGLQTLVLVPVGNDYKKPELIDIKHRLHMLACLKMDCLIDTTEVEFPYEGTLKTLNRLENIYQDRFGFVIGADQLKNFHTWIHVDILCMNHPMLIIKRPGYDITPYIDILIRLHANYHFLELEIDIASHPIRKNYKAYQEHISPCVYQYIEKNRLYEDKDV